MKCLAISNSYPPDHAGGYELGASNILESLAKNHGWENSVVASVRHQKSSKTDPLELTGFFPGKLGPEIELWRTRRGLLKHHSAILDLLAQKVSEADIVFVFNPRRLIFPQWTSILNSGKPSFVFVSDHWPNHPLATDIFHLRNKRSDAGELKDAKLRSVYAAGIQEHEVLKQFRGVLFSSQFLQNEQSAVFADNPHQCVTHWGIDAELFPRVAFSGNRLKIFGFCGRPEKEKGLELALETIRELAAGDDEVQLLVASDLRTSSFGRSILKRIHSDPILRNHVKLLGHMPHSELHAQLYSKIGILLFPSIWQEPFALTVLEAMASGAVVIGSSTGGTPEVVNDTTGYLFDPEVPGDLTRVCRWALENKIKNQQLADAGARRIRELHTLSIMGDRVNTFVRGLL